MYNHPPVTALRDALVGVAASRVPNVDAERQGELRAKVRDAVDDLKAAGWPPERVVIGVKQIARDAGLNPSRNLMTFGTAAPTGSDAVIVDLVRWCIERYYQTL